MPMKLSINRSGEFITHQDSDHPQQCGKVGARHYKYFVSITASNKKLSKDGFVMDNLWVDEYFQLCYGENKLRMKCDSCENMAQRAVDYFHHVFENHEEVRGVEVLRIYVRINGSDISFIEAEWQK